MTACVVIATYNRCRELADCLDSLSTQAFEVDDEVVVADNGSTDATRAVVEEAAWGFPVRLRYVLEPRAGKSIALAAALDGCAADILAFVDDDVLVTDGWLKRIRTNLQAGDAALVGGRVLPRFTARVPEWLELRDGRGFGRLASPLALLDYGDRREPLGARTLLGANLAVTRRAFSATGGFAGSLGKLRGTLLSGEDHLFCEQVQEAGFPALYDPAIVVRHLVPRERLRLRYFLRWFFWSGVTHARLDAARPTGSTRIFGVPRHLYRQLLSAIALTAGSSAVARWTDAVQHATRASFALGYFWAAWTSGAGRTATGVTPSVEAA